MTVGLALASLVFFVSPLPARAEAIDASGLIDLTNEVRVKSNLSPLAPNHRLTQAAYRKAYDILNQGYFAHTNPSGKPFYQWIEEEDYVYLYAGENLAIDFATNEGVMKAWLASPTHYANIMNKNYEEIGLVTLRGQWQDHDTTVIVQMFGSILKDSPTVLGRTLENLSADLKIRKDSLANLTLDLVMLPSLAGRKYFDIIARTKNNIGLALSNPAPNSIAQTPITALAEGETYQTLLKSESGCCQDDTIFALTAEQEGLTVSTPISYPPFTALLSHLARSTFSLPSTPRELQTNILLAGIISLLLLFSYHDRLKRYIR